MTSPLSPLAKVHSVPVNIWDVLWHCQSVGSEPGVSKKSLGESWWRCCCSSHGWSRSTFLLPCTRALHLTWTSSLHWPQRFSIWHVTTYPLQKCPWKHRGTSSNNSTWPLQGEDMVVSHTQAKSYINHGTYLAWWPRNEHEENSTRCETPSWIFT